MIREIIYSRYEEPRKQLDDFALFRIVPEDPAGLRPSLSGLWTFAPFLPPRNPIWLCHALEWQKPYKREYLGLFGEAESNTWSLIGKLIGLIIDKPSFCGMSQERQFLLICSFHFTRRFALNCFASINAGMYTTPSYHDIAIKFFMEKTHAYQTSCTILLDRVRYHRGQNTSLPTLSICSVIVACN